MPPKVKGISVRYDPAKELWRVWFFIRGDGWSESYATQAEARAVEQEYQRRLLAGEDIRPARLRPKVMTPQDVAPGSVRDLGDRWLVARAKHKKATTNDFYDSNLQRHIYPAVLPDGTVFGDLPLTDAAVTRQRCMAFGQSLIGKASARAVGATLRYNTRKGIMRTLSALCGWARNHAGLTANPAEGLDEFITDPDEQDPDKVVWTHEEADRFLATVKAKAPQWHMFFLFALRTGLRGGELVELQWDLDFKVKDHVMVQRQFMTRPRATFTIDDEGRRVRTIDETAVRVTTTKSKQKRRVWLRPEVQEALGRYKAEERERFLKKGQKLPALVFTGERGARVHVRNLERRVLGDLCRAADVPLTTGLHTTRHTFATVLLAAGEDLDWVSRQLGHAEVATTERKYRHYIPDDRRDKERGARIDAAWRVERSKPTLVAPAKEGGIE
jgi:integrase